MILSGLKYFESEISSFAKFTSSSRISPNRKNFVVKLTDDLGNSSFGEISPLPNFSSENFNKIREILEQLNQKLESFSFSNLMRELIYPVDLSKYPSVKFGFEQALFTLFIRRNRKQLKTILNVDESKFINSSYLIGEANFKDRVRAFSKYDIKKGDSLKIKFGMEELKEEIKFLEYLRDEFDNTIRIRIDPNKQWQMIDFKIIINAISEFNIEFIEQPFADQTVMLDAASISPISIIPDESVTSLHKALFFLDNDEISCITLKPMNIGFLDTLKIINYSREKGKSVIISSMFENLLGYSGLLFLSNLLSDSVHGLGTINYLVNNYEGNYFFQKENSLKLNFERYFTPDENIINW